MDIEYFRSTFRMAPDGSKPLYQQLYDYFKRLIVAGILKEGDQMLPEITICDELSVSRSTVRKAMDMLLEEGYISRHRGKGTHVTSPKMNRKINSLYNFTENMKQIGAVPSSVVLEAKVIPQAPNEVLEELEILDSETPFFKLHRIRCANGEPVLKEETFIPYSLCPGIETNDFSDKSLYEVLGSQYLLNLDHASESLEAVFIDEADKKLLDCKKDMPGFRIKRISYLDNGLPYEYTTSITRADKCVFQLEMYNQSAANNVPVEVNRSAII